MKKFSWKAEEEVAPHWYKIRGWLPNRYLPLVMFDSICIYKPNMKGVHTHNALTNKRLRQLSRSKDERHWMRQGPAFQICKEINIKRHSED